MNQSSLSISQATSSAHLKTLQIALKKLDPKNLEAGLPGREAQNEQLHNFLYQRLKIRRTGNAKRAKVEAGQVANIKGAHDNKTMFVCGVPGTGKTATVMRVLDNLEKLKKRGNSDIHQFKRAYINGQHLKAPDKVYCEMLRQFEGKTYSADRAQEMLDSLFVPEHTQSNNKLYYIAVIDELDVLYNERKNSLFYSLFDWPTSADSRLILIVIANAMDLSERFMRGRIQSRMGWEKLLFESYDKDSLVNIIKKRLGDELMSKCFDTDAVSLAAARISRSTGDARRILDLCRSSIGRVIRTKTQRVSMAIINLVATENLDAIKLKHLEKCPLLQLYILAAIMAESKNVSEDNVIAHAVYIQLCNLIKKNERLSKLDFVPGAEVFENALNNLAAESIIHVEPSKPLMIKHLFIRDNSDDYKEQILETRNKREQQS